ncbi:heme-binding protein [Thalassobaculum sp. OXR-137]|uniref:SOUL family heme-binding protein n=1 Tax=Thalassobaculum sp. OXR-137 TaxID=3100173 RepID=UPI002AC951FB|nr:heme-binding protein [Thalassobaculum sp. OXR-137]WPZ35164.1 heme-binding protein [Thalassobaculum sp. OXR-137]
MGRATKISIGAVTALCVLAVALAGGWYWVTHSVEQPAYTVVEADGDIELRDYPAMVVAEAATAGDRQEGVRQGFRALAGYIFAKDRDGERIAMTAPVIQQPAQGKGAGDGGWRIRFVMPSQYALDELPRPAGEDVALDRWPPMRLAAIRFSGRAKDADFAEHEARLRDWLAGQGLEAEGAPLFAYYDDPWTPGFLRRNEVLLRFR